MKPHSCPVHASHIFSDLHSLELSLKHTSGDTIEIRELFWKWKGKFMHPKKEQESFSRSLNDRHTMCVNSFKLSCYPWWNCSLYFYFPTIYRNCSASLFSCISYLNYLERENNYCKNDAHKIYFSNHPTHEYFSTFKYRIDQHSTRHNASDRILYLMKQHFKSNIVMLIDRIYHLWESINFSLFLIKFFQ